MDVTRPEPENLITENLKEDVGENDLQKELTSEKDTSPKKTKILQIAHVLQQKFVYITGGKDKEGHPLLICAQGTQSEPITEEEFKDTLAFIIDTANILWDDSKFLVIINRQTGKWSGVKTMLEYLENIPEKLLYQILILKPQGFLQRHFSNNDSKQIMKISKHMVVLLDGITMLDEYVELSQLPDELGGFHNFNVIQWVEYTTAIERFQVTCKKIHDQVKEVQKLFHKKVALPSIDEVNIQTKQQFQLVEDLKDDIHCTIEISDTLSPILNKPLSHPHRTQSPLDKYNSAQLQVCSDNLVLCSTNIEKLWLERKTYFEQARELCTFEEEYAKVSVALLQITSILESRTDIGDTLSTAKDLMGELDDFERKKKGSYESMMKLKEKGLSMIALFASFAHESIRLRINEIKFLIKDFEVKLESRRNLLQISLDVFECLDKLQTWCKDGVDLLAAQPVEAFNTEEGAKRCLKQLDTFMKNCQGINMKKMNQLNMLCKRLSNDMIDGKVKIALERIEEVKLLLEKREASLKKVAIKPVRPVQAVKALTLDDNTGKKTEKGSPKTPTSPMIPKAPTVTVNKEEIEIVVTDNIENYKRNKTFRKSLRMSMKRPVSSPAQLQMAEYGEDPEHRKKIRQVITELINTEHDYVNDLRTVIEGYVVAFDNENYDIPSHVRSQKDVVFGNIEEIYKFHHGTFLQQLQTCKNAPYLVGQVFMGKKDELQLYATYCKNKPKSEELRKFLHNTSYLIECQKRLGHQLNLDSYMLKPVQRITKYRLLLTEILKYVSKRNPAHVDITDALHSMKKVLRHVNDVMHSSGLFGFEGNLDGQGKLILQDAFTIWESKKNAIKKFTKLGSMHRQLFLFEKCLIFSKREYENGKDLGTYQCKKSLRTADIGVTETVKGDICKFEVWVHGRSEAYILQAQNVDVKTSWLTEIRKILMSQFEGVKDSLSRKASTDDLEVQKTRDMVQQKLKSLDHSISGSSPNLLESSAYTNTQNLKSSSASNLLDTIGGSDGSLWSDSEFEEDEEVLNAPDNSNHGKQNVNPNDVEKNNKSTFYVTEFPAENSEIGVNTFTAIADYEAVEEFEISFESGALINLIKEGENGWWFCKNLKTSKEGWAPSGYLELYAVDVSEVFGDEKKAEPVKPSAPSPRRRLETAV